MKKRHDVLFEQLKSYRSELVQIVGNISGEEANYIPDGFNNNIRWNLGHILVDQYLWIKALTKEDIPVPKRFIEWFGYGTSPTDFTIDTPVVSQLIHMLQEQPNIIKANYRHRMEEEFTPTELGMHTIEQVLIRTIFHEGLHMGAILAIKKHLS